MTATRAHFVDGSVLRVFAVAGDRGGAARVLSRYVAPPSAPDDASAHPSSLVGGSVKAIGDATPAWPSDAIAFTNGVDGPDSGRRLSMRIGTVRTGDGGLFDKSTELVIAVNAPPPAGAPPAAPPSPVDELLVSELSPRDDVRCRTNSSAIK